jgi:hypothetical protein
MNSSFSRALLQLSFLGLYSSAAFGVAVADGQASIPLVASAPVFRPGAPWPDTDGVHIDAHGGNILYENGTFYWFGELQAGGRRRLPAVSVFVSKDLYHWTNGGAVLSRSADPASDFTAGCTVERPKVLHHPRTGKYVMWMHLELRGQGYKAARAAVAVSDTVTGPYRYLTSFRPNGNMSRDMNLYLDDDGRAYEIYAARDNYDLRICRLSDDFLSPTTNDVRIASDHREAPAPFKYQGRYYLITSACTGFSPNAANYYTADHILGPWKAHPNPCVGPKAETTFDGQSTFVLPVPGKPGAFIFTADRWLPRDLKDSGHIWLPIQLKAGQLTIPWLEQWDLSWFDKNSH